MHTVKQKINCLLTDGGLGDMVASFVAVDYIHKTWDHVELLVWVPDYILGLAQNLLPNLSVRNFTTAKQKYNNSIPNINTRWNGRQSPLKTHVIDYAFNMLCDYVPSIEHKNYLKANLTAVRVGRLKLPENYIVITTGFTAPNREFLPKHINSIVDYARSKNLNVVFLGKRQSYTGDRHIIKGTFNEDIDYSRGSNLVDKTTLLEAAKIMQESKCVIGLDNGLLHLSGCTNTTIIGGFTNVDPITRLPVRNNILGWNYHTVVPDKELSCKFCQTKLNFVYGHDFKTCYEKTYECLNQMTAEKFIEKLELL